MDMDIVKYLEEQEISFEAGDLFVLLASTAKELAQRIFDMPDEEFNKAYYDRVCSFKMGKPICEAAEAADYGIYLFDNIDDVQQALSDQGCNIHETAGQFTVFCHKHNGHILVELTESVL